MAKKIDKRKKVHAKLRKNLVGTAERPRVSVFRSNSEIYAQIIDDSTGNTMVSFSSTAKTVTSQKGTKIEIAKIVGVELAKAATAAGVESVVFDRSGYIYHGRVKALAEGAREGGLKF